MKHLLHVLLLSFIFLCATAVSANVFRVNNNLATDKKQKIYKTVIEAHSDAAVLAGDTLMIEGSGIVYADITLTKRLVLIGPGYLLTQNPQTQANAAQAIMSNITIPAAAAGTILIGLTFSSSYYAYAPYIQADNVIVMRCYLPNNIVFGGKANNVQIIQNFFFNSGISNGYYADIFSGLVLKNNIIQGAVIISSDINYQRTFDLVENNIFLSGVTLTAKTFRSNIITNKTASVTITSSNIQNNLVTNTNITGNGFQVYDDTQLFVGSPGTSPDGQYKIKPTSPYKTAGYNNTEPGVFGGTQSYVLSGIPPLPAIYEFTADGFGSKQTGLPISIKVKANQ